MNTTVRRASSDDLIPLLTFAKARFIDTYEHLNAPANFRAYLDQYFTVSAFEKELVNPKSLFYVLEQAQNILAYIKLNLDSADGGLDPQHCIELERIYVEKAMQGSGYGKQMIEKAIAVGKTHQKNILWLGVWENNPKAIQFYERMGFETYGTHIFQLGADQQNDFLMKMDI
ncbi:MAG: GNAT family N-acetyltransferase [Bacteroidota bacterium]